jgi:hypothetical protein
MLSYSLRTAPQLTETGPVLESVPLYRALYIAEDTAVTANLTFTPIVLEGTAEEFKPVPGCTTIYNLVGDGRFGMDFWYTLSTEPTNQWLELVGDFGYGPNLIVATGASCTIKDFMYHGGPRVRVTAFDILTSVHYLGTDPLTYSISIDEIVWFSNTDPRKAALELNSTYAGQQNVYVRVTDGDLSSISLIVPVTVIIDYF